MIRKNEEIEGIQYADHDYRVSLFVDDIALFLSSPIQLLTVLDHIMTTFHEASGLSLNKAKLELYPILLTEMLASDIKILFPYCWITSNWKYLGVTVPLNLDNIYRENVRKLLETTRSFFLGYARLNFSWMDKINIVKSFMVSKFMLPVSILKSDLRKWQTTLNNFIWSNKRHRISHAIMRMSRNRGSLGIPDLALYYEAAQLANIMCALNSTVDKEWMRMEFFNHNNLSKHEIIWAPKTKRPVSLMDNSFCRMTLQIWDKWKSKLTRKISSPFLPLTNLGWFSRDLEVLIKGWNSQNVWLLNDVQKKRSSFH